MISTLVRFKIKKDLFVVTYDEYGVLDTIAKNGKALVSTHRDAKRIARNAERIKVGRLPDGWERMT